MRRISTQIESLGAMRFVLLIALIAGTIQSAPLFFLSGVTGGGRPQLRPFLVIGIAAVIWWSAAFLLWWIAVRRRQSAVWVIAVQVTLALILADLVHAALAAVSAAIETRGQFTALVLRDPWMFVASNLQLSLFRAPLWLLGAVVVIAMGRRLADTYPPQSPSAASTTLEPVT